MYMSIRKIHTGYVLPVGGGGARIQTTFNQGGDVTDLNRKEAVLVVKRDS